jgi:thioredoxin reductase (NADPH)
VSQTFTNGASHHPDLPVILVVDYDSNALSLTREALARRFGLDYTVLIAADSSEGLHLLQDLAASGTEVALIIAAIKMSGSDGPEFLEDTHELHPGAVRALMIEMGDAASSEPAMLAVARHQADFWVIGGWESPEEWLYPQVQEALTAWSVTHRPRHEHIRIVGDQWSPRCHELRDLLTRNMVPYGFYDVTSEKGQHLCTTHGAPASGVPVVILFDGRVIENPTNAEVADALGVRIHPEPGIYDVVVLGAGPAGLAAAVYAASEGLRTVVIEPQAIGGQAGSSSMIRNYPGFPRGISGNELTYRSFEQAMMLGAEFVFSNWATGLAARGQHRVVTLTDGSEVTARAVVIATGVSYRRLDIPALDRLIGRGVFYGAAASEAVAMTGQHVCVVGGANSAGQAALHLAKYANRVTILVRGESLTAGMSDYLIREIEATPRIEVRTRTRVVDGEGGRRLNALVLEDTRKGERTRVEVGGAFILIGAEPLTDWLEGSVEREEDGHVLTGDDAVSGGTLPARLPMSLETSMPGVFAIGDVRSGSVKRVVSAVGDGGVAIGQVHRYLALQTAESAAAQSMYVPANK